MDDDGLDDDRPSSAESSNMVPIVIGLLVLAALGGGAWWWLNRTPETVALPAPVDAGVVIAPPPVVVDAGEAPPLNLDEGDALLRKLAAEGGASPELSKWLEAPGIVRRITAAVWMISKGKSPRALLGFMEVPGGFSVRDTAFDKKKPKGEPDRLFIAAASTGRYDLVAGVFKAVDPAFAGKSYRVVAPYFQSAFSEVAQPGERFDDVLRIAIDRLTGVRVPSGPIELVPKGAIYAFKDPALESAPEAEKHLLRMGHDNAATIQQFLTRFAESAELKPKN